MPAKKRPPSADAARLRVLATTDDNAHAALVREMLASGTRLQREAALDALIERPQPALRDALRAVYFDLDADGAKRDQAAHLRGAIVRILIALRDVRDTDIAVRASDTYEKLMGGDVTYELRTNGLRLLAHADPDLVPYLAAEHLDDRNEMVDEPANTALQLLAASGHTVSIYQWLLSSDPAESMLQAAFELLADAPDLAVQRYIDRGVEAAIRRMDEAFMTSLAEAIVAREIEASYGLVRMMMSAKISDELYNYLAVLLAGTNRTPLIAILQYELHRGRRPRIVAEALRIRTTPQQAAILKRWEDGDPLDE